MSHSTNTLNPAEALRLWAVEYAEANGYTVDHAAFDRFAAWCAAPVLVSVSGRPGGMLGTRAMGKAPENKERG